MVYPLPQCMLSDGIISQLVPRSPWHSPPLLRGSRREGRTEVARQPLLVIYVLFGLVVSPNHLTSSLYILVIGQHLLESPISRWIWGLFMLGYEMTPFKFPTPCPKVNLNGSNAYRSYRNQLYIPSLSWSSLHPTPPTVITSVLYGVQESSVLYGSFPLAPRLTHGGVYVSALLSECVPPPPSLPMSTVSSLCLFLPYKEVHQ